MEKKIILTEKELHELILQSYLDGFGYCQDFEAVWKKENNSQGKDACSYTEQKIKELIK